MRVDDFDFELPSKSIALRPLARREAARLLHVSPLERPLFRDHHVKDLPAIL